MPLTKHLLQSYNFTGSRKDRHEAVNNRSYSPLEHLARSVWFPYSDDGRFALLTSYFDAAGGKDHGFLVVAGYVARLSRWEKFAADWRFMLKHYEVPYFHMKKFAPTKYPKRPFDGPGWKDESHRESFLRDLGSVIATYIDFGVACFVPYAEFLEVNKQYHLCEVYPLPYVLAGRDCIATVNKEVKNKGWTQPIEYIFECGDRGKGALVDLVSAVGLPIPTFKPSRDIGGKKGVIQLQASDFAAFELRKAMKEYGEDAPLWKYRRSLMALAKLENYWQGYTKASLIEVCEKAGIPPRTPGSRIRVHKKRRLWK